MTEMNLDPYPVDQTSNNPPQDTTTNKDNPVDMRDSPDARGLSPTQGGPPITEASTIHTEQPDTVNRVPDADTSGTNVTPIGDAPKPVPPSITPSPTYDVKNMPYPALAEVLPLRRDYDDAKDEQIRRDMVRSLAPEQREQLLRDRAANPEHKLVAMETLSIEERVARIERMLLYPADRLFG